MTEIYHYLKDTFEPLVDKSIKNAFIEWLDSALVGNIDDKRLLCCIAIDIYAKRIPIESYTLVFNAINYHSVPSTNKFSCEKFDDALRDNQHLHEVSVNSCSCSGKIEFVRIVTIKSFINYYLPKTVVASKPIDLNDEDSVIVELSQSNNCFTNKEYELGAAPWKNIAWVASAEEFFLRQNQMNGDDVSETISSLALPFNGNKEHFTFIVYPLAFDENTYPPISLNSGWEINGESCYISFSNNSDDWGRTRTYQNDGSLRMKERIHWGSKKVYLCSPEYFGWCLKDIQRNDIAIEAENRFTDLLKLTP